jgi:hypothetical protein
MLVFDHGPAIRTALCQGQSNTAAARLFALCAGAVRCPSSEQRLFLHALLANLDQAVFEMQRARRDPRASQPGVPQTVRRGVLHGCDLAAGRGGRTRTLECQGYALLHLPPAPALLTAADTQRLVDGITAAADIVCVAGPLAPTQCDRANPDARDSTWGPHCWPTSTPGLRCDGPGPGAGALQLYLRAAVSRLPPADLVLYFGDRMVSEPLREYLAAHRDGVHPVFPVSPAAGCHRERVHLPDAESLGRSGCLCCRPGIGHSPDAPADSAARALATCESARSGG